MAALGPSAAIGSVLGRRAHRKATALPREWDARTYDSLPLPHTQWGQRVLDDLDLRGDEYVLDAGAGTGRDTMRLLELLPDGQVLAIDGSARMLEQLEDKIQDHRLSVRRQDLTEPIEVERPVDAVMSVATFHWIDDHATLFRRLADAMATGAQLVTECGGEGNVARVSAAAEAASRRPSDAVWRFGAVDETRRLLDEAGFEVDDVRLRADPARLEAGEQFHLQVFRSVAERP